MFVLVKSQYRRSDYCTGHFVNAWLNSVPFYSLWYYTIVYIWVLNWLWIIKNPIFILSRAHYVNLVLLLKIWLSLGCLKVNLKLLGCIWEEVWQHKWLFSLKVRQFIPSYRTIVWITKYLQLILHHCLVPYLFEFLAIFRTCLAGVQCHGLILFYYLSVVKRHLFIGRFIHSHAKQDVVSVVFFLVVGGLVEGHGRESVNFVMHLEDSCLSLVVCIVDWELTLVILLGFSASSVVLRKRFVFWHLYFKSIF